MNNVAFFHYLLFLVFGAGLLTWLARNLKIAPAVVLLLGGSAVALLGGGGNIGMDPGLVLAAVLPPLLMSSSFYTAWKDFRQQLAPISSLVLGAVLFTTLAVAIVVHAVVPLPWAACFALGAIVSPPDAVAAKAMLQRFPLPTRLVTVLEGESLVNDASGLLLYQMAVAAAISGQFTGGHAAATFVMLVLVGMLIGFVCGHLMVWSIRRLGDAVLSIVLTFLMAWISYSLAEHFGGSGVLSVVVCGLVLGVKQHDAFDADLRIKAESSWETIVFVLDALVFILIGLELHGIWGRMQDDAMLLKTGLDVALPAVITVIVARLVWVFAFLWLPSRVRGGANAWSFGEALVLGWAGMRGVVSLAVALALPATFPGRDVIVFSTFIVIFATLVLQGLSLAPLIRVLRLRSGSSSTLMGEHEARAHAFRAALMKLERMRQSGIDEDTAAAIDRLIEEYQIRVRNNENAYRHGTEHVQRRSRQLHMQLDLVAVSRHEVLQLHESGRISDPVLHRIESELDLEELRLHRLLA